MGAAPVLTGEHVPQRYSWDLEALDTKADLES